MTASVGQALQANTPSVSGTVTAYSISPALPAGLSLNTTTGAISGTPTASSPQTTYTITASSATGSTSSTVQITVSVPVTPPSGLGYSPSTISATVGQGIASVTPTVTGSVSSYSVSPSLPAGLSLNTTTGTISGTPTVSSAQATYTITATNSGGSATATVQIAVNVSAPSGLAYSPSTISATVGQAIATLNPSVSGTVSSYSVSPALPAGLSLNTTTGAISGTPTASSTQATYTVVAANASGSVSATLQITVNAAVNAPSALSYPQATVTRAVGEPLIPNIPSYTGTATSFAVSPALPAGVTLDATTGTISGTATTQSAQASYTVTAANAGGSTTATVSLTINKAPTVVMDLGQSSEISGMRSTADRLLSQDQNGHWVLWNTTTNTQIASGDQYFPALPSGTLKWTVDMAGATFVIGQPNGAEVRSTVDGHLLALIAAPTLLNPVSGYSSWMKLASDGSYIAAGSNAGVAAWSTLGQLLFNRQGNYSSAKIFPSPGQVQIALGPAGQNVIETISTNSASSTTGPAFSGSFNSWFLDGQRFLTNTGTTVWTYSSSSAQQAIVSLSTVENLGGLGNWIWTSGLNYPSYQLNIYAVGANTASATFTTSTSVTIVPSSMTLGVLADSAVGVVDLSGSSITRSDFTPPFNYFSTYTAASASRWFVGDRFGDVIDGSSANSATSLTSGLGRSLAGGTGMAAIATANGLITRIDPANASTVGTIPFPASKLALSSDDSTLAAAALDYYATDRTLKVFSLPSGTTLATYPYTWRATNLVDFTLAGSGSLLGQITGVGNPAPSSTWVFTRQVAPATGGTTVWSDNPSAAGDGESLVGSVQLSPDGTEIAVVSGSAGFDSTTNIYKNGVLTTAVVGYPIGWLDNNRLLVKTTGVVNHTIGYLGSVIYDSAGTQLSTSTIPELFNIVPIDTDRVYSVEKNTIYSLSTGAAVWTGPTATAGTVVGGYVIYAAGNKVIIDTY